MTMSLVMTFYCTKGPTGLNIVQFADRFPSDEQSLSFPQDSSNNSAEQAVHFWQTPE